MEILCFYCYNSNMTNIIKDPNKVGELVRFSRKKSGLSQKDLAKLAGVGKTVVFDIEKGKESIQLNTLIKVLDVLNIKLKLDSPFSQSSGGKE